MYYKRVTEYGMTFNDDERTINRKYAVIMGEITVFNGSEEVKVPSYGIEISEHITKGSEKIEKSEFVPNISPYFEKVDEIARYFKKMDVSPLHLNEIIDEMYYEYIEDFDKISKISRIAI